MFCGLEFDLEFDIVDLIINDIRYEFQPARYSESLADRDSLDRRMQFF